jgi:hypothetical protein
MQYPLSDGDNFQLRIQRKCLESFSAVSPFQRADFSLKRFVPFLFLIILTLAGKMYAHPDPPGPPTLEDWIVLKELYAETDQDDGINGETEYFLRITVKHAGHPHADAEIIAAFSVNWDDIDPDTGLPYDEGTPPRLPLVGKNGALSSEINCFKDMTKDRECSPSEAWTVSLELKESNTLELALICSELGKAFEKIGTNIPPELVDPRIGVAIILTGPLLTALGNILDQLYNTIDTLGIENPGWTTGEGDNSTNAVPRSGDALNYSYKMEKHVVVIPGKFHECAATNTPTESPDHSFGDDTQKSEISWEYLRSAAQRIDAVDIEPGETNGPAEQALMQGLRQTLRELMGTVGRSVAFTEVQEAQSRPDRVPPQQLNSAIQQFQAAENFRQQSLSQSNTAPLLQALQIYQQVFNSLAVPLHKFQASALDIYQAGDQIVINWQHGGILQVASAIDGSWTNVPYAITPFRAPLTTEARFFRVHKP